MRKKQLLPEPLLAPEKSDKEKVQPHVLCNVPSIQESHCYWSYHVVPVFQMGGRGHPNSWLQVEIGFRKPSRIWWQVLSPGTPAKREHLSDSAWQKGHLRLGKWVMLQETGIGTP